MVLVDGNILLSLLLLICVTVDEDNAVQVTVVIVINAVVKNRKRIDIIIVMA